MQIDKAQILRFLKERGQQAEAEKAEQKLPDKVDTDRQGGLLAQDGISVDELLTTFGDGTLDNLL